MGEHVLYRHETVGLMEGLASLVLRVDNLSSEEQELYQTEYQSQGCKLEHLAENELFQPDIPTLTACDVYDRTTVIQTTSIYTRFGG